MHHTVLGVCVCIIQLPYAAVNIAISTLCHLWHKIMKSKGFHLTLNPLSATINVNIYIICHLWHWLIVKTVRKTGCHLTSTCPAGKPLWLATVTPSHIPSTISWSGFAVEDIKCLKRYFETIKMVSFILKKQVSSVNSVSYFNQTNQYAVQSVTSSHPLYRNMIMVIIVTG